jgi:hypothetical protein
MSLVDAAITLLNNRFSVIPCGQDKKCTISWKDFQSRLMTEAEARNHFANADRLAIIGGALEAAYGDEAPGLKAVAG